MKRRIGKMKRIISVLLIIALLITSLPMSVDANNVSEIETYNQEEQFIEKSIGESISDNQEIGSISVSEAENDESEDYERKDYEEDALELEESSQMEEAISEEIEKTESLEDELSENEVAYEERIYEEERTEGNDEIDELIYQSSESGLSYVENNAKLPESLLHPVAKNQENMAFAEPQANELPAKYSSVEKGYVTAIKNQSPSGTCWAHAATAAMETSALRNKLTSKTASTLDFSERHLAYDMYHKKGINDPLGNTAGDYLEVLRTDWWNEGCNFANTQWHLVNWTEPAQEMDGNTFENISSYSPNLTTDSYYNAEVHVQRIYNYGNDASRTVAGRDIIKNAVMEDGLVMVDFHSDSGLMSGDKKQNVYSEIPVLINHAVGIVGWDDNYSAYNFKSKKLVEVSEESWNGNSSLYAYENGKYKYYNFTSETMSPPPGNGAWLVKNSWGEGWGDNGYYWISYYDKTLADFYSLKCESSSNYDHLFHYDGGTYTGTEMGYSFGNTSYVSASNVFTNTLNQVQVISAVGIGVETTDVEFEVQIYKNPDLTDPASGTPMLAKPQRCSTTFAGYYTFPLDEKIYVDKGERFSVVFTAINKNWVYFYVDKEFHWDNKKQSTEEEEKTSFIGKSDLTNSTLRIKAYTDDYNGSLNVLSDAKTTITLDKEAYAHTGTEIFPKPVVRYSAVSLVENRDYVLTYQNNVQIGKGIVIITGKGLYTGTQTIEFNIKYDLDQASISDVETTYAYTGNDIKPVPTVLYGGRKLTIGTDYKLVYEDNKNVTDQASVTIIGAGNYTGSVKKIFSIIAISIEDVQVNGVEPSYYYTGEQICPEPVISRDGKMLVKGQDYSVTYQNNTDIGKASLKITGLGNLKGTMTITFSIVEQFENVVVSGILDSYTYTGKTIKPVPVVTLDGITLEPWEDYTLFYDNCKNVGTGTISITGSGPYKGQINKTFNITPLSIEDSEIRGVSSSYTYNGKEIKSTVTVIKDGEWLTNREDFTVSYENNIESESVSGKKATVKVTGIGNYTGEITAEFSISPREITDTKILIEKVSYVKGMSPKVELSVTYNGEELNENDYSYSFAGISDNGTGKATIIIKGKNNYTGTSNWGCTIKPCDLSELCDSYEIDAPETYIYTGESIRPRIKICDPISGEELVEDSDYKITKLEDNINAGVATFVVEGCGAYYGEFAGSFTILPRDIQECTFEKDCETIIYSGNAIMPCYDIYYKGQKIRLLDDYQITGRNTIDVGVATTVIEGKNNFTGKIEDTFQILPSEITIVPKLARVLKGSSYPGKFEYKIIGRIYRDDIIGEPVFSSDAKDYNTPGKYELNISELELRNPDDYKITYEKGELIVYEAAKECSIEYVAENLLYLEGQAEKALQYTQIPCPEFEVEQGYSFLGWFYETEDGSLEEWDFEFNTVDDDLTLYAKTEPIQYCLVFHGNGGKTKEGNDIWKTEIIKYGESIYFGTYGFEKEGYELAGWCDWDASDDNIDFEVNYTCERLYFGDEEEFHLYAVWKESIAKATVSTVDERQYIYQNMAFEPNVVVQLNNKILLPEEDYTIQYLNNINAGTATISVNGIGEYRGYANTTFVIKKASATIIPDDAVGYAGCKPPVDYSFKVLGLLGEDTQDNIFTTKPKIICTADGPLEMNQQYEIRASYASAENYEFQYVAGYLSVRQGLSSSLLQTQYEYTGDTIKPQVTVNFAGQVVDESMYSVQLENNVNAGTAEVIITGKGIYEGYKEILNFSISKASLTLKIKDMEIYTGDAIPMKFEYLLVGLKGNDAEKTVITKEPLFGCDITNTSRADTYEISASGAEADNYIIDNYISGTLKVVNREDIPEDDPNSEDNPDSEEQPIAVDSIVVKQKYNISGLFVHMTSSPVKYKVESVDGGKASVNSKGVLTARKAGTVRVTPYIKVGRKMALSMADAILIEIRQPVLDKRKMYGTYAGQIISGKDYCQIKPGMDSLRFYVKSSKNPVVSVDANTGDITALRSGKTKVYVEIQNKQGFRATYSQYVTVKIPKLNVKQNISMKMGRTKTVILKNAPAGMPVEWKCSDDTKLSYEVLSNNKIKVRTLSDGRVTLTATVENHNYETVIEAIP